MLLPRSLSIVAMASVATAIKEVPLDESRHSALYANGLVHQTIMSNKDAQFARQRAAGAYNSAQYQELGYTPCVDGLATAVEGDAMNTFRCNNIDLYHFMSHADLGSQTGEGASSWGWTSDDSREFIAISQADGAAFAEISPEGKMVYLGRLPQTSTAEPSIWREIRGYKNFMIIGSEAVDHGIQIFDMSKLLDIDSSSPVTFNPDEDVTGQYSALPIGRSHNVVINEATNFVYAVGAQPRTDACAAGLIFIDVSDPANPTSPGCAPEDGYVHDAQCLVYAGPDTRYVDREICYGYNEDTLTIYDVTDKQSPEIVARVSYEGASYTHQGWVLDPMNQEYLLLDDEYDEYDQAGIAADGYPVTYIWDIKDLASPKLTGYYKSGAYGIDHNQYVHDGKTFQSNYGSGLRILDISSIPEDPSGAGVHEIGFFDIYPENDAMPNGGDINFEGTWSSYSYFKSGFIFVNTIERGGFVVKLAS
ncbi:hypothetical protein BDY21DRAFT_341600 [Lineolata rhizophorae]|uniref:Regulatory P domain-containing protein n=1 Tax=Lineolata rhizophorae TaxID=578093 RepID=A0A6A6P316_9PEZI|nr:hypothetical protein BDY21DRAFT_341600 [Lineolata rhizophorae]